MKVRVEIRATDGRNILESLKSDFDDKGRLSRQSDISWKVIPQPLRHAFPGQEVVVFFIQFAAGVSAGVIANWLYDKLRGGPATVVIGKKEVPIENIEKLVEIIIEESEKDK